jgi:hypothetical protein
MYKISEDKRKDLISLLLLEGYSKQGLYNASNELLIQLSNRLRFRLDRLYKLTP